VTTAVSNPLFSSLKPQQSKTALHGLLNTFTSASTQNTRLLFSSWILQKAFDTIEHSGILEMMKSLGFSKEWLQWTSEILSLASTTALLNGIHGKNLKCKRGVRQGDPMSPLLFVLAAKLLQCLINKAHQQDLF
jgi:hypothetical protein